MTRTKGAADRAGEKKNAHAGSTPATTSGRLRRGTLDGLVLDYMARHRDSGPFTPGTIAKGLEKSAGAVANSLVRLARDERVREVSERPLRYSPTV